MKKTGKIVAGRDSVNLFQESWEREVEEVGQKPKLGPNYFD